MNKTTVFSKTGKGLLEIKNKSNRLSKDQFRVLNLVDGKATLDDLIDKSRVTEVELRKALSALSDGGFIKEFNNPTASGDYTSVTIPPVPPSTSYVDDLDFTQILGPAKPTKPAFYQTAQTEQTQREQSERKASEAAAAKLREETEKRDKEEAARLARETETARRIRAEAERRAKEEQARLDKLGAELRGSLDADKRAKEDAERKAREKIETEKRIKEEAERRVREEAERRTKIQAEAAARVELERKRLQDEERKRREDEVRRRLEEEERKSREEEERKRKEEGERKRKEEEERKRREDEERLRREEEERKHREEEERKRKEEEERKRRAEEERKRKDEEERKRHEEEERKRKEEEERKRREEEERRRQEEQERKRHEEEEEHRRQEEEERKRKEEEERKRKEEAERLRRELEERHRREEEDLVRRLELGLPSEEEERRQRAELERKQREEDEHRRREEDEERRRREEDERRREDEQRKRLEEEHKRQAEERKREEEQERRRKEEQERKRKEEQERKRRDAEQAADNPFPSLDLTTAPAISRSLDTDLDALKRAEAEVEKEFMAKEAAIRSALEEQERRFRLEDEARTAMDRAEREARQKADQEARELAQAAEQARREAEQRAREDSVRRQQEDKEKRAKEQEERKKKSEEERKNRERERREQEQRAREESLARKRAEQEELDRKKSERERLAQDAKKRAWGPGRTAVVVLVALVGLLIGLIQVAPLSAYAPEMEKLASEAIGEPVRIGGVHASMFPGFHLNLDSVTVGQQQDVKVPNVIAYMDFGSLFGDQKIISSLQIEKLQATQEVLSRLPVWLGGGAAKSRSIKVQRVVFKGTKLEVKGVSLPAFDANVFLATDGTVTRATIETVDRHFEAEIMPKGAEADVTVRLKNFTSPFGPAVEFIEGQAKGVVSGNQLRLSEFELFHNGGQSRGQAVATWGSSWNVEGELELKRVELEPAMKALKIDITSDGTMDARTRFALQSNSLEALFNAPRIESTFTVQKGNLAGFDFVRALQSSSRDGVQGGKTRFDELSGTLSAGGGRYVYSNMRLVAGLLSASGSGEILPTREINGRAYVELRSSSNVVKGSYKVTGTVKAIVLKP